MPSAAGRRRAVPAPARGRRAEFARACSRPAGRSAVGADAEVTAEPCPAGAFDAGSTSTVGAGAFGAGAFGAGAFEGVPLDARPFAAGAIESAAVKSAALKSTIAESAAFDTGARRAGASPRSGAAATLPETTNGTAAPHRNAATMAVARRARPAWC